MGKTEQKWRILGWTFLLASCGILLFRGAAILGKHHFREGKAVLRRAAAQAEQVSIHLMMPLLFYDGKEERGWMENLLAAVQDQLPLGGEESRGRDGTSKEEKQGTETAGAEISGNTDSVQRENARAASRGNNGHEEEDMQAAVEGEKNGEENSRTISEGEKTGQEETGTAGEEIKSGNSETENPETKSKNDEAEKAVETAGMPREILYQEAETIQETIPQELLLDPQALLNRFFVVDPNTSVLPGQITAEKLLKKDLTLEKEAESPQILIYHTHSQEAFSDSRPGEEADTVIGLGNDLQELLEKQYGYGVLHITEAFDLEEGYLERSRAYNYAEPVIAKALEEHPSVQVVIDLHRDGVSGEKRLVTEVNGKPTAQIMFFNGLSRTKENGVLTSLPNPYLDENLAFSFQLEYQASQYYPGFTRCIYLKGYRYNLHLRPRSVLLEVGAQTNTVEEVKNAMGPFADLLHKVLAGKNQEADSGGGE